MEFAQGRIVGFEPRFDSLDKDWERYMFALVELEEAGKLPPARGRSLYVRYGDATTQWLVDRYFEKGRLDALEAYYTPQGETFYAPMHAATLRVLERMLALGEFARVRRIWRAHVGLMKGVFWFYVGERKRGFRMAKYYLADERTQRREYEALTAQIPERKRVLLAVLRDFLVLARRTAAPDAEIARIEADIASVEAEERPKPPGKPDPRPMTEALFWEIVDQGLGVEPLGERLDRLPDRLARFKARAIREFDRMLRAMDARAYRSDIWALAWLLQGGCSDDAFEQFRGWLILQGRAVFEAALDDPDGFDTRLHGGVAAGGMDALRDAAPLAYEMRQGKAMRPVVAPPLALAGPELDEEAFPAALPRIAAAVGWNG